nr:immunoglobulin light chain junction region [Macaca mulatta]
CMQALEIPWTF